MRWRRRKNWSLRRGFHYEGRGMRSCAGRPSGRGKPCLVCPRRRRLGRNGRTKETDINHFPFQHPLSPFCLCKGDGGPGGEKKEGARGNGRERVAIERIGSPLLHLFASPLSLSEFGWLHFNRFSIVQTSSLATERPSRSNVANESETSAADQISEKPLGLLPPIENRPIKPFLPKLSSQGR